MYSLVRTCVVPVDSTRLSLSLSLEREREVAYLLSVRRSVPNTIPILRADRLKLYYGSTFDGACLTVVLVYGTCYKQT